MRSSHAAVAVLLSSCFLLVGCKDPNAANPPAKPAISVPAKSVQNQVRTPRVMVKRAPCKLKFGPIAAAFEVDLSEIKNLVLDAKELYAEIINGEPSTNNLLEKANPIVVVVNKQNNRFTYFHLGPNVKEVRLKDKDTKGVALIVKNQEPLQIELWIDTPRDIDFEVEFKESPAGQP